MKSSQTFQSPAPLKCLKIIKGPKELLLTKVITMNIYDVKKKNKNFINLLIHYK